jgi:PPOX class probable F420-dependent enzyme
MSATSELDAFLAEPRNVIVGGVRRDGRPHLSPNWFVWDGANFYVSTTRSRAKYHIFRRDPRAELVVDDSTGFRYVGLPAAAQIRENVGAELPVFRAIREKYGREVPPDDELAAQLVADNRILLAFTPSVPQSDWIVHGLG